MAAEREDIEETELIAPGVLKKSSGLYSGRAELDLEGLMIANVRNDY